MKPLSYRRIENRGCSYVAARFACVASLPPREKTREKAVGKRARPGVAAPVLSEARLLAMPDKSYMNDAQRAYFRDRLLALRRELLDNVSATSVQLRQVEVATDPNDRATQEEEQAIELRARDRERKLMKKIDRALAMLDEGSYGWCEETGEPIGLQRLLARPTATLSVEAQERREKLERVYGH